MFKQWLLNENITETPEFKSWFAGSKVVDKHGNPLLVFHGTESGGFKSFKGFPFFSENKKEAEAYANITDTGGDTSITYIPYKDINLPDHVVLTSDYQSVSKPNVIYGNGNNDRLFYWDGTTSDYGDYNIVIISGAIIDKYNPSTGLSSIKIQKTTDNEGRKPRKLNREVKAAYLSIKNPINLPWDQANLMSKRLGMKESDIANKVQEYKSMGYDGIFTVSDDAKVYAGKDVRQFIPFNNSQIKIADNISV